MIMSGNSLLSKIRPDLVNKFCNREYLFGRNAIYAALNSCKRCGHRRIWMPAYSCGDEIAIAIDLGLDLKLYKIKNPVIPQLDIDINQVQDGDIVFLVHFFGCVDDSPETTNKVMALKLKNCIIIEDAAYALFSKGVGLFGDFIVFSLRKSLPLPHGAILCYKNNFKIDKTIAPTKEVVDCEINNFNRYQNGLEKIGTGYHIGIDSNNIYGARYKDFGGYKLGCSDYVIKKLDEINLDEYKKFLLDKFKITVKSLSKKIPKNNLSIAYNMANKSVYSQFLPIIVENSSKIYQSLQKEKINFALPFWDKKHSFVDWNVYKESSLIKKNIIALHLAYPINNNDLDRLGVIILQKENI